MSATTVKLLHAAAEMLGGNKALAARLGVSELVVASYLADRPEIPDALLLRIVDIILTGRQVPQPAASMPIDQPRPSGWAAEEQ